MIQKFYHRDPLLCLSRENTIILSRRGTLELRVHWFRSVFFLNSGFLVPCHYVIQLPGERYGPQPMYT